MKLNFKFPTLIYLTLIILLPFFLILSNILDFNPTNCEESSEFSQYVAFEKKNLKFSTVSGKIHIKNNWTDVKSAGICTGNGSYSEPYIIEDLIIDIGRSGSGILIENSNVYFKIENCSIYNSGTEFRDAGIRLYHVSNAHLIENDCSSNYYGIWLEESYNNTFSGNKACNNEQTGISINGDYNTVSGNDASNNDDYGIYLSSYCKNTILGNTANNNTRAGIQLSGSFDNIISFNTINYNEQGIQFSDASDNSVLGNIAQFNKFSGIKIWGDKHIVSGNKMFNCGLEFASYGLYDLNSHEIDITNLVNGKPLFYYTDEVNLRTINFTNAGQIILVNCNKSLISNLDISYTSHGLSLYHCYNDNITENIVDNNRGSGIHLSDSNEILVSGNILDSNSRGISLHSSHNNIISDNTINNNKGDGIHFYYCSSNTVHSNFIENNNRGIAIFSGSNNKVYHNCFTNYIVNALDYSSNTQWDNGESGNLWGNYNGTDEDGNGIGSIPYYIKPNGYDYCPLMECPQNGGDDGPLPQDGEEIPIDVIINNLMIILGGILIIYVIYSEDRKKKKRWRENQKNN